jgi:hypothetical protein
VVNLASNNTVYMGVPSSVTVAAGATTATFTVTTKPYLDDYSAPITVSDALTRKSATLSVLDDSITSLTFSPTTVLGGTSSTGTVTLLQAAPAGGWVVTLSSNNTVYMPVPTSVTVPAGATTATFTVTPKPYIENYSAVVTASDALTKKSATLNVTDTSISSVTLNPSSVTGGSTSTGTVTLLGPAPAGGWVVTLVSGNTVYVGVPTTVTVAAGATTATFTVTTKPYATTYTAPITASDALTKKSATITVTP